MLDDLTALTDHAALEQYGINVVDVRIKRLNLPEQNKQSVYARMRAERERIARQYRAEGEEQALSIRADADRQREEILSVAYKQAEKTKGEGDAESTRIYGQAYSKNPKLLQAAAHARSLQEDSRRQDHGDPQLGFGAAEGPDARSERRAMSILDIEAGYRARAGQAAAAPP